MVTFCVSVPVLKELGIDLLVVKVSTFFPSFCIG